MKDHTKYAVGFGAGLAADVAWRLWPEHTQFYLKLQEEQNPLAAIEHFHWGLIALIFGRLNKKWGKIGDGFGTIMIFTEAVQSQPFGIGEEPWQMRDNLLITSVLGGILGLSWALTK